MIKTQSLRQTIVRLELLRSYIDLIGERDTSNDIKATMISDIKDNYDKLIGSMNYSIFLEKAIPIFTRVLSEGNPCFVKENSQQEVRNGVLNLIDRLPRNDKLKPYIPLIIDTMVGVIRHDNEENVLVALRIIHNLFARLTPSFDLEVLRLLDLVRTFYTNIPSYTRILAAINDTLMVHSMAARIEHLNAQTHFTSCCISLGDTGETHTCLPQSQHSMLVLQELPRLVLQLSQLYGSHVQAKVAQLVPSMVGILAYACNHVKPEVVNTRSLRELLRAQVRALAFLGTVLATHHDAVAEYQHMLPHAMVNMLADMPARSAGMRRELIGALRLFATPLSAQWLLPVLPSLCQEQILVGDGYTSTQMLRPLAFGVLGRLLLGMADSLGAEALAATVNLFARNLVDTTLPHRITVLSCQVLTALVCPAMQAGQLNVLANILRLLTLRVKMVAKAKQSIIFKTSACDQTQSVGDKRAEEDLAEQRALIGQLAIGLRTITSVNPPCVGFVGCQSVPGNLKVTLSAIKWAIRGLVIFSGGETAEAAWERQGTELVERLVSVLCSVTALSLQLSTSITVGTAIAELPLNRRAAFLIGRMLLAPLIAFDTCNAVMDYVLEHLADLGDEETVTVARLLMDQVCSCVSAESGDAIATRSLEFVEKMICQMYETKESLPFLTVLNSVFRVLGDRAVHEIKPAVPELVTCLIDACHVPQKKQHKKLMLETVLIIPVALTNLLTLLPQMMDAVVMALSQPAKETVEQGLKSLNVLVNSVDRGFLLKETRRFAAPLRAALTRLARSEWPEVRSGVMSLVGALGTDLAAEPQALEYREVEEGAAIWTNFLGFSEVVHIPIKEVVETAVEMLLDGSIDSVMQNHCWEVCRSFIVASIRLDDDGLSLHRLFMHPSFTDPAVEIQPITVAQYKMANKSVRELNIKAITGILLAGSHNELRGRALKMIMFLSSYYTLLAIAQQTGPCPLPDQGMPGRGVDSLTYIDALAGVLALDETELIKPALLGLMFVMKSATATLGNRDRAGQLPLLEYASQRVSAMCYERGSQRAGCIAIKCLAEHMEVAWNAAHVTEFARCLLYVIRDSACRIAHGALERARGALEKLVSIVTGKLENEGDELVQARTAQARGVAELARELLHHVIDIDPGVRHTAMQVLTQLARCQDTSLHALLEPHKRILSDRVLPKRGVLNQFSTDDKIASLEATTFCVTTSPRLFDIDPEIEHHRDFLEELFYLCRSEEGTLFTEREKYATVEDAWGSADRWGLEGWIEVRKAAVRLLATLHFLRDYRTRIVLALFALIKCRHPEIQDVGFEAFLTFRTGTDLVPLSDLISVEVASSLEYLFKKNNAIKTEPTDETYETADETNDGIWEGMTEEAWDKNYVKPDVETNTCVLRSTVLLLRLFPEASTVLTRELARQIIETQLVPDNAKTSLEFVLRRQHLLDAVTAAPTVSSDDLETWLHVYSCVVHASLPVFQYGPTFLRETLVALVLGNLAGAVEHLLSEQALQDEALTSLLIHILRRDEGQPLREKIKDGPCLVDLLGNVGDFPGGVPRELRYQAIRVIHVLAKRDNNWLVGASPLLGKLRGIWCCDAFHKQHSEVGLMPVHHWNCPRLVSQVLLQNFLHNLADFQLIFQIIRALCCRYIADVSWLLHYLETSVAGRTSAYRRLLFFAFTEPLATAPLGSARHQGAILERLVTPNLRAALSESVEVLGAPSWDNENIDPSNIASVFVHHILELKISVVEDYLCVEILKLACLLVTRASSHVYNAEVATMITSNSLGSRPQVGPTDSLQKLTKYAWPCLSEHVSSDPLVRHYGYLLLANVIKKIHIRERVQCAVIRNLLRSDSVEVRPLVLQSLELVTLQFGRGNGPAQLHGWFMAVAHDCDDTGAQMTLLLQAVTGSPWVYFNMISLGIVEFLCSQVLLLSSRTATNQQRKLAIDLLSVMIDWAERCDVLAVRRKEGAVEEEDSTGAGPSEPVMLKPDGSSPGASGDNDQHFNLVLFMNVLLRIGSLSSEGPDREMLKQSTERCIALLKRIFKLRLASITNALKLDWLLSGLLESRSAQCQTSTLKLLICVGGHMPYWQAGALAAQLNSSALPEHCKEFSVLALVQQLAVTLNALVPGDLDSNAIFTNADLEPIDSFLCKLISDGLSTAGLEKDGSLEPLQITVATLEALVVTHAGLIDRFCDHMCCTISDLSWLEADVAFVEGDLASEILIKLLDLVKSRVPSQGLAFQRQLFSCLVVDLINRARHSIVMDQVITMVSDCLTKKCAISMPEFPEAFNLLVQLAPNIGARFGHDAPLQERYLHLVHFVFKEKTLRPTDQSATLLEPAMTLGLHSSNHDIRSKFVSLVDSSVRRRIDKRIVHALTATMWLAVKNWTPYAIDLVFAVITTGNDIIKVANSEHQLLGTHSIARLAGTNLVDLCPITAESNDSPRLHKELLPVVQMLEGVHEVRSVNLLHSAAQLCFVRPSLARAVWLHLLPRLWPALTWDQQAQICCLTPLMTETLADDHVVAEPTGDSILVESLTLCCPRPDIHWGLLQYAGKHHNLWHRMALALEQMSCNLHPADQDGHGQHLQNGLARLYEAMSEDDLRSALQQHRSSNAEARHALLLWQLGSFHAAQEAALDAVDEIRDEEQSENNVAQLNALSQLWTKCTRELGKWEALREVSDLPSGQDIQSLAECAWRLQDLEELGALLPELEDNCDRLQLWKLHLYRGYVRLFREVYDHAAVAECVKLAREACVLDWMRLPAVHGAMHVPRMHEAQLILELEEANAVTSNLYRMTSNPGDAETCAAAVKSTLWRWEHRGGNALDDLVHLSAVEALRQSCYAGIARHSSSDEWLRGELVALAEDAYENSAVNLARTARKRDMPHVCVEFLLPAERQNDLEVGWQRMRQVLKAACQLPCDVTEGTDLDPMSLVRRLDLSSVPAASLPDALALCGHALRMRGEPDADAWTTRALSCAGNTAPGSVIERWAEQLEATVVPVGQRARHILRCWLAAERDAGATTRRRILAKVIWLVQCCDDEKWTLAFEAEECQTVRPCHWLPWIPQLLEVFAASGGEAFFQLLLKLGSRYPQALYLALRTLYVTQKANNELARLANGKDETTEMAATRASLLFQCSKLLATILRLHPTVVSPLEVTSSELMLLRDSWAETCIRDLRRIRSRTRAEAFACLDDVVGAIASPELLAFISARMVNRGFKETLQHRKQNTWMLAAKLRISEDFVRAITPAGLRLAQLSPIVDRWLGVLVPRCANVESILLMDKCRYLSTFTRFTATIGMFDEDLSTLVPSNCRVLIHNFLPFVEVVHGRRWIRVRGSDGHIRSFQLVTNADTVELRRQDRLLQLLELLNEDLDKDREAKRRGLRFNFPRVTSLAHDMQLVAITPSSVTTLQVYQQLGGKLANQCVNEFYQNLARQQTSTPYYFPDLAFRHSYYTRIKSRWSATQLLEWARETFPDASQFWTFRKALSSSLAVLLMAEHALYLTRIDASALLINRATGNAHASALTFDVKQLDNAAPQSHPVAFRLTESMALLLGVAHVDGVLTGGMLVASRCLARPASALTAFLRAVLSAEAPADIKADTSALQQCTIKWSDAVEARMTAMAQTHKSEGAAASLVEGAQNQDNLCQMDPAWLPWL